VLDSLTLPVVGAPMAGGVSTPALVAAVSGAGGLGMLPGGYLTPEELAAQAVEVRERTDRPFGINLFVPQRLDRAALERAVTAYRMRLLALARARGAVVPEPFWGDTDHWEDKAELVRFVGASVVSCTFGVPPASRVAEWHEAGLEVHVTVTDPLEAAAAQRAGADVLVVQGAEAGGHRGTFDPSATPNRLDHLGLLAWVGPETSLPLVAAGGVTTSGDTGRALAAGAAAVQVGTALLLSDESGASVTYRAALRDPDLTTRVVTRAFSGRAAGAVRNDFVAMQDDATPAAYPVVDQLTKPLRRAAARQGDVHGIHVWAGTGWRAAQERPAADIVRDLVP
jgi:nitronate monooxygenase